MNLFRGIIQFNPGKLQAGKGTGLGLYISKGIIDKHDGYIWVDSEGEGLGATFTVLVPLEASFSGNHTSSFCVEMEDDSHFNSSKQILRESSRRRASDSSEYLRFSRSNHGNEDEFQFPSEGVHHFDSNTSSDKQIDYEIGINDSKDNEYEKISTTETEIDVITECKSTGTLFYYRCNFIRNLLNLNIFTDEYSKIAINILIVDDSSACRSMICKSLMSCGEEQASDVYNVCCDQASDGKFAVEMVRKKMKDFAVDSNHQMILRSSGLRRSSTDSLKSSCQGVYDLILMDYQMPNMDGPTAIREIRALGYKGKIVGLTGNALADDLNIMRKAGADEVLTKPVKAEILENVIFNLSQLSF